MLKRKLLLADDSVTIQKVVNLTFADQGIEVLTASEGNVALRMVDEFAPDLVMVDVNLPGLSGFEICEHVKSRAGLPPIPVILLVGSLEPFDQDRARRAGADDVLTKPFQSIGQLVSKVSALLPFGGASETRYETQSDNLQIDNEIVQSDQIGSLPADEARKFETKSAADSSDFFVPEALEDARITHFKDADEYSTISDFGAEKTRPLSADELREITAEAEDREPEQFAAPVAETIGEPDSTNSQTMRENEFAESSQANFENEQASKQFSAGQIETGDNELIFKNESVPPENVFSQKTSSFESEYLTNADDEGIVATPVFQKADFPPDVIDAIADKIIEKLFEKIVREVAAQVVEQKADSIIRQVLEDRLK